MLPPHCLVVGNVSLFFLEGIDFPFKHNVAPCTGHYPKCARSATQTNDDLNDHSLISLIFSLVEEYLSRMNLEVLILHFKNKNCFDVSIKQFAFEILQLSSFFLEKRLFALVFGDFIFGESML
jgi:hypothetical protein